METGDLVVYRTVMVYLHSWIPLNIRTHGFGCLMLPYLLKIIQQQIFIVGTRWVFYINEPKFDTFYFQKRNRDILNFILLQEFFRVSHWMVFPCILFIYIVCYRLMVIWAHAVYMSPYTLSRICITYNVYIKYWFSTKSHIEYRYQNPFILRCFSSLSLTVFIRSSWNLVTMLKGIISCPSLITSQIVLGTKLIMSALQQFSSDPHCHWINKTFSAGEGEYWVSVWHSCLCCIEHYF